MIGRPGWSLVRGACGLSFRAECLLREAKGGVGLLPEAIVSAPFREVGLFCAVRSRLSGLAEGCWRASHEVPLMIVLGFSAGLTCPGGPDVPETEGGGAGRIPHSWSLSPA